MRIASCVDCALTIVGDRARCPACSEVHATTITTPEVVRQDDRLQRLLAGLVGGELVAVVAWIVILTLGRC